MCLTVAADPGLGKRGLATFGHHGLMHKTPGLRDPAAAFRLPAMRDDVKERRDANRQARVAVALGFRWGDPIAGIAVTLFICHVGYQVTGDVAHRLADGVDPAVITNPTRGSPVASSQAIPSGGFPERGDALAHADAHGGGPARGAPAAHLVQQGGDDPGAGAAQRVADGDRAAVDVDQAGVGT